MRQSTSSLRVFILLLLGTLLVHAAPTTTSGHGDHLTNAERFKRGLPPLAPVRRYDPSSPRAHLARRSAQPTTAYLMATPTTVVTRRQVGNETHLLPARSQPNNPTVSTSYVYYNSGRFMLTVDKTQAAQFTVTPGTTDALVAYSLNGNTIYMCGAVWSGPSSSTTMDPTATTRDSVDMTICNVGSFTVDSMYGLSSQVYAFTVPSTFPGDFSFSWHNGGTPKTVTDNIPLWTYSNSGYSYLLGAAQETSDFGTSSGETGFQQVKVQWVTSLD